jgi:hypothetical protein
MLYMGWECGEAVYYAERGGEPWRYNTPRGSTRHDGEIFGVRAVPADANGQDRYYGSCYIEKIGEDHYLILVDFGGFHHEYKIEFCPWCGAKLNEENGA